MILDDQYITKDMLTKDSYKGNYYANKNAVMYDLQNGKQNVVCFCDNIYTAQGIVEGLNLLDKLEADGIELRTERPEQLYRISVNNLKSKIKKKITMTQNKIAKILIQTIIKELGGKLNGQGQYLDGMCTQF